MNKSKTNVMVENDTPTYVDRSRMLKSTSTLGRETAPETNKTRQGVSMKNHGRIDSIRKAPRHVQGQNWNMLEETRLQSCVLSAMTYGAEIWTLTP